MAEPEIVAITAENARLRRLNQQLLATVAVIIEAGLAGLDRHDGEADLEPYLAGEVLTKLDPSGELEAENEHGGDILDEPHDDSDSFGPDAEDTLGRSESIDQTEYQTGSDDGEPSLGWTDAICQGSSHWRGDSELPWSVRDGEEGDDNGYGDLDGMHDEQRGEASLGWTLACSLGKSGATWTGGAHDLEDDGEDREPEEYLVDSRDPIDQRKLEQAGFRG